MMSILSVVGFMLAILSPVVQYLVVLADGATIPPVKANYRFIMIYLWCMLGPHALFGYCCRLACWYGTYW